MVITVICVFIAAVLIGCITLAALEKLAAYLERRAEAAGYRRKSGY